MRSRKYRGVNCCKKFIRAQYYLQIFYNSIMKSNIKKIVSNLIKKYNTNDPYILANYLDIEVIEHDLASAYGMYKLVKRNKFIFLNNK